jgi:hypothetical protein
LIFCGRQGSRFCLHHNQDRAIESFKSLIIDQTTKPFEHQRHLMPNNLHVQPSAAAYNFGWKTATTRKGAKGGGKGKVKVDGDKKVS